MVKSQATYAPRLVSISGLCDSLGIKRTKAFEIIRDGEVETIKIGRRTLVLAESIDAFIDRCPRVGGR